MAPSSGFHKLVARNYRLFKAAWQQTTHAIRSRIPASLRPVEFATVRVGAREQPLHPIAYLRQSKGRWFSSGARHFSTGAPRGVRYDRTAFPKSRTASAVNALPGRAPFASTLRPNLTGGTLGRTAGGYSLGSGRIGGARYFSHSPAAPAQVLQNVSQAVRAFYISGHKAQYGGIDPRTGEKRYCAVSALQAETSKKMASLPAATPGSYIDFAVNPTITALTPLASVAGYSTSASLPAAAHVNSDGLISALSVDFSRALRDLAAVLNDLKKLSSLGDLPIAYHDAPAPVLRVHFPGCDADSVERLCTELGVTRGVITQDAAFDAFAGTEIALLFPFAPSAPPSEHGNEFPAAYYEALFTPAPPAPAKQKKQPIAWQDMLSVDHDHDGGVYGGEQVQAQDDFSTRSEQSAFDVVDPAGQGTPAADEEGYASASTHTFSSPRRTQTQTQSCSADDAAPLEYREDFEGIYRFIELCDASRR